MPNLFMVFCLCKTDLKIVSGSLAYRDSQYNIPQEIKHQVPSKKVYSSYNWQFHYYQQAPIIQGTFIPEEYLDHIP
jgi:hypothetical protein